jgi:hypothetical protein
VLFIFYVTMWALYFLGFFPAVNKHQ